MKKTLFLLALTLISHACVTVPVRDLEQKNRCELSTDKKTLKIIDLADETVTSQKVVVTIG